MKDISAEARTFTGIASTPEVDAVGDIVEPQGGEFKLPLPLLWQHDSSQPIGNVTSAIASQNGITITAQIAQIAEPGRLRDRIDEAWQSIRAGLVRGLSIGFSAIEAEPITNGGRYTGMRFLRWAWRELSAVTIPANQSASITAIKAIARCRAAEPVAVYSLRERRVFFR